MLTRDDYERLISHNMKEGDIVRVPCKDDKDYHAQRMTVFRLLKTMKSQGLDVNRITIRKQTYNDKTYLELEHQSKEGPKVIFITPDGEKEHQIDRTLPTREDQEFENWMKSVHQLQDQDQDK